MQRQSTSQLNWVMRLDIRRLAKVVDPTKISALPHCLRGRPLMLCKELYGMVRRHLLAIRSSGGIVNRRITLAKALGIVRARKPSLLVENGGGCSSQQGLGKLHFEEN